ncbi:hypothetical protein HYV56_01090 [Candidatus Peregrinibacteria bacterium]|nr:hypothetical protein [Candidatus Peregrinibacteria bacterium]
MRKKICRLKIIFAAVLLLWGNVFAQNQQAGVEENIYFEKNKSDIQTFLEEKGFYFIEPSYVEEKVIYPPLKEEEEKTIFLETTEGQKIPLKIEQKEEESAKMGQSYSFELKPGQYRSSNVLIQLENFRVDPKKDEEKSMVKMEKQSMEYTKFEITYEAQRKKTYYRQQNILLSDMPNGRYEFNVQHPYYDLYDIKIQKANLVFANEGMVFVEPGKMYNEEYLQKLDEFMENGGNLFIVSNKQIGKKYGISFRTKKLKEDIKIKEKNNLEEEKPKLLFKKDEKIEFIEINKYETKIQNINLWDTGQGSLIQKIFYSHENGKQSEITVVSKDIFSLNSEEIAKMLPYIDQPQIEEDSSLTSLVVKEKTNFLIALNVILVAIIIWIIIGQKVIRFIKRENKKQFVIETVYEKFERIRKFILQHIYPIFTIIFFIFLIAGVAGFKFYRWYITSSGLDLFPNFKINDFLARIGILSKKDLFLEGGAIIMFFFLMIIGWLFWEKVLKASSIAMKYRELVKEKVSERIKLSLLNIFFFFGILLLYSIFLSLPGVGIFIILTVLTGAVNCLLLCKEEVAVYKKNSLYSKIFKTTVLVLPLIVSLKMLAPAIVLRYQDAGTFKVKNEELFKKESPIFITGSSDQSKRIGEVIKSGEKKYLIISSDPFLVHGQKAVLDLGPKKNYSFELGMKIKSGKILTLNNSLLYLPEADNFSKVGDFENHTLMSQSVLKEGGQDQMTTMNDFMKKYVPEGSTVGVMKNEDVFIEGKKRLNLRDFYTDKLLTQDSSFSEWDLNILNTENLRFFTFIQDKLDLTMTLQKLGIGSHDKNISIMLRGKNFPPKVLKNFKREEDALEKEGQIQKIEKIEWKLDGLQTGVYEIKLYREDLQEKEFVIKKIKLNSKLLTLQGDILSQGETTFYFKNLSNKLQFEPAFNTELSFFDLEGTIEAFKSEQSAIESLDDLTIDPDKMWKLKTPSTGGTLKATYNFYALNEQSWFNPYRYYFTDISSENDFLITPFYKKPDQEEDFAIVKATVDGASAQEDDETLYFSIESQKNSEGKTVILDWLELTIQKK